MLAHVYTVILLLIVCTFRDWIQASEKQSKKGYPLLYARTTKSDHSVGQ